MSRQQVRKYDADAIARGVPGIVLMENAGRGVADWMIDVGVRGPVAILCGKGNNAGDGFVIARQLQSRGCDVRLILLFDPTTLSGDAAIAWNAVQGLPITHLSFDGSESALLSWLDGCDWVVDSMLGTGMTGELREPFTAVIGVVNHFAERGMKVLAVDLPSGLDCDTGVPNDPTIVATHTATFVAMKVGFAARTALPFLGQVRVMDIGAGRV